MKNLITLIALSLSGLAFTQDFYVQNGGNDGGPGSMAQPWESIQHAMDNATPGSTVYIQSGTYNERLYVNVDGTAGNYITFLGTGPTNVIVDGAGLTDYALLEMYDVQYVAIEGLKFMNNEQLDAVGILIEGVSDHIRIEDCDISNINFSTDPNATVSSSTNAQALIVYGNDPGHAITDLEIIDNEIFDCRLGFSEALAVNGNVDGFVIAKNEVHDVTNIGIDIIGHEGTCSDPNLDQARNGEIIDNETYNCLSPYATSAGIYVDGAKDLLIERNRVHHNQWGIEIGCETPGKTTNAITVRNNFIYANSTAGIACGGYDYPNSGSVSNTQIINNTLFGNDTENDYSGEMYLSHNVGMIITGNIFYATNTQGEMMSDENLSNQSVSVGMYNNMWYHPDGDGNVEFTFEGSYYATLSAFQSGTGFGTFSAFDDPMLISTGATPDLHIAAGSPAEDYGNGTFSSYGPLDIDGGLRNPDGEIDLGADEIDDHLGIVDIEYNPLLIFPNPALDFIHIYLNNKNVDEITILDLNGKIVVNQTLNNEITNISNLKPGIYMVRVMSSKNRIFQQKLIVK